jgi:hypothetical protein
MVIVEASIGGAGQTEGGLAHRWFELRDSVAKGAAPVFTK